MYSYTVWQWIILFFSYSFCGWIWEIIYLSIKNMYLVTNRGILAGPLRTMYGAGALIILLFAAPVRDNLILSYLSGMIGATLLELVVGFTFEKIFHRKCWNYSEIKMNICGHICLPASLLWGFFAVLFIKFIHPFVHLYLIMLPNEIGKTISIILIFLFIIDIYYSFSKIIVIR